MYLLGWVHSNDVNEEDTFQNQQGKNSHGKIIVVYNNRKWKWYLTQLNTNIFDQWMKMKFNLNLSRASLCICQIIKVWIFDKLDTNSMMIHLILTFGWLKYLN